MQSDVTLHHNERPSRPRRVLVTGLFIFMLGALSTTCALTLTVAALIIAKLESDMPWWLAILVGIILLTWLGLSVCMI